MRDNSAHRDDGSMKTLLNRLDADTADAGHERHKRPEDRDPLGALRAIDLNVIAAAAANDDQLLAVSRNEPNLAELRAFLGQNKESAGSDVGAPVGAPVGVSVGLAGGGAELPPHPAFVSALGQGSSNDDPDDDLHGDLPKVVASRPAISNDPESETGTTSDLRPANGQQLAVRKVAAAEGPVMKSRRPLTLAVGVSLPLCLAVAYVVAGWFAPSDGRALRHVPAGAGALAVASSDGLDLASLLPALEPLTPGAATDVRDAAAAERASGTSGEPGGSAVAAPGPIGSSYITDASGKRRFVIEAPAGEKVALPVELGPASATAEVGALVVRGLPHSFTITGASAAGDGSWVLAPQELQTARIVVPRQAAGEVDVAISLFDFAAVEVGLMGLRLKIAAAVSSAGVAADGSPLQRSLEPDRGRQLLARGRELLELGDVASARLLFERAAEGGDAQAALLVGETYDPVRLAVRGVIGLSGSAETAKGWYQRALAQGVDEAKGPLSMLAAFETSPAPSR